MQFDLQHNVYFNKFVKLRSKFQAYNCIQFLLSVLNHWLEDNTLS